MQSKIVRGIEAHKELDPKTGIRDIRTPMELLKDYIKSGEALVIFFLVVLSGIFLYPALSEEFVVLGFIVFFWASKLEYRLPFRIPLSGNRIDPSLPRTLKLTKKELKAIKKETKVKQNPYYKYGEGIDFLGNDLRTNEELWFSDDDMRTHMVIFGSTGSGKALDLETLVHTNNGFVKNKNLKIGDLVSTNNGEYSSILGLYPRPNQEMYKIIFEDGREIEVSSDHLWEVNNCGDENCQDNNKIENIVLETSKLFEIYKKQTHEPYYIPMNMSLDSDNFKNITSARKIKNLVDDIAKRWLQDFEKIEKFNFKTENEYFQFLAEDKESWINSSRIFRLYLFNAIIDLFKIKPINNKIYIKKKNNRYIKYNVMFLIRSLGWKAFEIEDKIEIEQTSEYLKIVSITKNIERKNCQCIKIQNKRGLFVIEGFIVTHNTESLISLAYNALIKGSGFLYIDGKGDSTLWSKIYSIARSLGREDDILIINYMKGGRDSFGPQSTRRSNTINPFTKGSAGFLTESIVSLMDESGGDGMWKGRAISLISSIMLALVWMRDYTGLLLDVEVIRDYLILDNIQKLAKRRDLPANILQSLKAYLRSLPGYVENAPKQSETVLDQHGYLQMQFTRIMGQLSDTYGYIFKTNLGEVDFFDVVVNRRILIVLLPALENSPDELANLGKIILVNLKQMMAATLGSELEGEYEDIIANKPTNSPAPYVCILDEYGYYVVKGASVMAAQARSLGFCMIYAGQDYPSFKKNNNAEEAAATIGNCNIKIFMKIEDPTDTFDLFQKTVGQGIESTTQGFSKNNSALIFTHYTDNLSANIQKRDRGDIRDLKDQSSGEAHIIFKSILVRAGMFYANPPKVKKFQLNHFIRVEPPDQDEIKEFDLSIKELSKNLLNESLMNDYIETTETPPRLRAAIEAIKWSEERGSAPLRTALSGLWAAVNVSKIEAEQLSGSIMLKDVKENEEESDSVNIFSRNLGDENEDLELMLERHRNARMMSRKNKPSSKKTTTIDSEPTSDSTTTTEKSSSGATGAISSSESSESESSESESSESESSESESSESEFLFENDDDTSESNDGLFMDEMKTMERIKRINEISGLSTEQSESEANNIIEDMKKISTYPNISPEEKSPDEILDIIEELNKNIE